MRWIIGLVVFVASVAGAAPRTVIVAGDCSDPALISGAKDFRDTAGKLLGESLMEPESVLEIVRPPPIRSVQDIERQVDSAKALFYGGQVDRARELVERALADLERASPQSKPWPVTQQALVLLSLVHKSADRPKDMAEAFRKLVRLDPSFKLDPDAHPPSAIAALDAVKKELARSRKTALTVRIDAGPAAEVFIDGQPMGPTPLKIDVPPGTYRVSLTAPGMLSFPHRVEVPRDTKLSVDLNFEGAVGQQAPLCLLKGAGDDAAMKLGQLVTAERLIVLRNTSEQGAPPKVSGTLFDLATGQQTRSGTATVDAMGNLAVFLVTGKKPASVDPSKPADAPVSVAPAPKLEPAPELAPAPPVSSVGVSGARLSISRIIVSVSLLAAGAGAIAGAIRIYMDKDAVEARGRLPAIIRTDGKLPESNTTVGKEAISLMKLNDTNRAITFTLVGAGAGAIAAGVLGLVLFPATTSVAITPTPEGGAMTLSGTF